MYTINLQAGTVTRDEDGKVISPCQDVNDADFMAYQTWVMAGNNPVINDTPATPDSLFITVSEFRDRLTRQELDDILNAAYHEDSNCQMMLLRLQTAGDFINVYSQEVKNGIGYLQTIGILTEERANQILS